VSMEPEEWQWEAVVERAQVLRMRPEDLAREWWPNRDDMEAFFERLGHRFDGFLELCRVEQERDRLHSELAATTDVLGQLIEAGEGRGHRPRRRGRHDG
jgi:hypothetical protein